MTLAEAWLTATPVLVQNDCAVTAGLTARSGGGLTYDSYSSFDTALGLLLERPGLAAALGASGQRFVQDTYGWDRVLDDYETLMGSVVSRQALSFRPTTA